ncbi:MAG: sel1 repeat family protein, partial [Deltaproteobacteria bacterium]|nr:sel1 repeat family protein [Deltaproteobacteria bacterium]
MACFLLAAPWALAQEPDGPENGPDLGDLSRLADKGDYEATYELALRCYLGGEEERDPARAYGLARPLAEGGDPFFQFLVGDMFATGEGVGQDPVEAARWLALSAGQGRPEAQYGLGLLYEEGRGVGQDLSQALRLYRLSAEQG